MSRPDNVRRFASASATRVIQRHTSSSNIAAYARVSAVCISRWMASRRGVREVDLTQQARVVAVGFVSWRRVPRVPSLRGRTRQEKHEESVRVVVTLVMGFVQVHAPAFVVSRANRMHNNTLHAVAIHRADTGVGRFVKTREVIDGHALPRRSTSRQLVGSDPGRTDVAAVATQRLPSHVHSSPLA